MDQNDLDTIESQADRALLERYLALPEDAQADTLEDIAEQVARRSGFVSAKQRGYFTRLLRDAEKANDIEPAPAPRPAPQAPAPLVGGDRIGALERQVAALLATVAGLLGRVTDLENQLAKAAPKGFAKAPAQDAPSGAEPRPALVGDLRDLAPETKGLPLRAILLERVEGRAEECVAVTLRTWAEAETTLRRWAETAPDTGGYHKCDFEVEWSDGYKHSGRFDLARNGEDGRGNFSLRRHVYDFCTFDSGARKPDHLSEKDYAAIVARNSADRRLESAETVTKRLGEPLPKRQPEPARAIRRADIPAAPEPPKATGTRLGKCPACGRYASLATHKCAK